MLNSDVADIANAKPGNTAGGMLLAGVFLKRVRRTTASDGRTPPIPWAHLDIAGPGEQGGAPTASPARGRPA